MKIYFFLLAWLAYAAAPTLPPVTILTGTITDVSGQPLVGATVKVMKDSNFVRGAITDTQGTYRLSLAPATYTIEVSYTGFPVFTKENFLVETEKTNRLDITLVAGPGTLPNGDVLIKGGRTPSTNYHSGIPISNTPPPVQDIEQLQVSKEEIEPSGAPVTGGIISIAPPLAKAVPPAGVSRTKTNPDSLIEGTEEQYNTILENPYQETRTNSISTFSIDVDAASYANLRRHINSGQMPPRDAVRIEEMVNYFDYQYPQPTKQHPFEISTELAPCPWAPEHRLLLIGLQGQSMDVGQLPAANLVFLIDVSGSMSEPDKLPLVQQSLDLLTDQLRPNDHVAIVVYAGAAGTVLESTPGSEKLKIKAAIDALQSGGSTAGGEGIRLAYQLARKNFVPGGNNRVILCTDGDFNVGVNSAAELVKLIEQERNSGVFLTVLGFGTGNYQDGKMQQLADKGNGNHAYIDGLPEARKVLVQEFGGTLFAIAKDVKLQLHFNPAHIAGYRLIGYENRMLATEDFQDDRKDAGELGAGHRVTALYELVPAGQTLPSLTSADSALVVVAKPDTSVTLSANDLLVLQLRYKQPKGEQPSRLMEYRLPAAALHTSSRSENLLLASAVAEFGLLLRDSKYKGSANYPQALEQARKAAKNDRYGYCSELVGLIERASQLPPATASSRY